MLPVPAGVTLDRWLLAFPSYGFLVVGDPAAVARGAGGRGLAAAAIGTLDASGVVRLASGGAEETVWDLGAEPLTGLGPGPG